jgi:release factor glutamine methyltransferase
MDLTFNQYKKLFFEKLSPYYDINELKAIYYILIEDITDHKKSALNLIQNDTSEKMPILLEAIEELSKRRPIQHITGLQYFYGLKFIVDKNVLIPRQETEELVDYIIKKEKRESLKVLDIGTGSGCIPIALKHNKMSWRISGLDISEEAIKIAKLNANSLCVDVEFINEDLFNNQWGSELHDIIISNPPYIPKKEKIDMEANVLEYEPHLALFVENDNPLEFYEKIVELKHNLLKKGGSIYFEIHPRYEKEIHMLLNDNGFSSVMSINDYQAKPRFIHATN